MECFRNHLLGDRITVVLNGILVIDNAQLPGIARRGRIGLQHHGAMRDGHWVGPPSLVQYRNISIEELDR
jgi:3-keto-disaccharide hydrolase